MEDTQVKELLLQVLEHERGGIALYEAALGVAQNDDLRAAWEEYLERTRKHVGVLEDVLDALSIDPDEETPGRAIVEHLGAALLEAIHTAAEDDPDAAELVACECIVLAETRDHLHWELIGACAKQATGDEQRVLQAAYDRVGDEKDEHLYHTRGWCRELWLQSLGLKAVLPPREERRHVTSAIGAAALAEQGRDALGKH